MSIQGYTAQSDLPRPHGLTMYATLSRGERSYDGSYCFKGLDGLKNLGNYNSNSASGCHDNGHRQSQWGSGVQNVQWAIETYNPEIMAIGLWCPNNGAYDDLLTELADFFKQYQSTKFLLRTCYEFNGDAGGWSDVNFRNTFKYVRTFLYVPEYCGTVSVAYMAIQPLYYAPQMAEGAARRRALAADLFAQGLR